MAILYWLLSGYCGTLLAIMIFRPDGTTSKKWELYQAVVGPLLGPFIILLLILDWSRRS